MYMYVMSINTILKVQSECTRTQTGVDVLVRESFVNVRCITNNVQNGTTQIICTLQCFLEFMWYMHAACTCMIHL